MSCALRNWFVNFQDGVQSRIVEGSGLVYERASA
jgi:hypothetical protein